MGIEDEGPMGYKMSVYCDNRQGPECWGHSVAIEGTKRQCLVALRGWGWSIGKTVTCPACKEALKTRRKSR